MCVSILNNSLVFSICDFFHKKETIQTYEIRKAAEINIDKAQDSNCLTMYLAVRSTLTEKIQSKI